MRRVGHGEPPQRRRDDAEQSPPDEDDQVATRGNLIVFVGWGLFCIVATALGWLAVANAAHAGGFLFGLAVGELAFRRRRPYLAGAALVLLATLTVASVTWMPWSRL